MGLVDLLKETGLVSSNSEGFRMIQQGGVRLNGEQIKDKKRRIITDDFDKNKLILQKGKKKFIAVVLK